MYIMRKKAILTILVFMLSTLPESAFGSGFYSGDQGAGATGVATAVVAAVNDTDERYSYPDEVRFEWSEPDIDSYRRAADFINFSNSDVVSLQH